MKADCSNAGPLRVVTANGYCVGCGACASFPESPVTMLASDTGFYTARTPEQLEPDCERGLAGVCPFSAHAANEDELSAERYRGHCAHDPRIGYYLSLSAGFVSNSSLRGNSSSGGIATWVLSELRRLGHIDGVIHAVAVRDGSCGGPLFRYGISTSEEEIRRNAKARYYPLEFSAVLGQIRNSHRKYAVVGVPCFIKALRLLQRRDECFRSAVAFTVSLFCGHLKGTGFATMMAWQLGIRPNEITSVDFRAKLQGRASSDYGFCVEGARDGERISVVRPVRSAFGADWGLGLFKYKACDYCDDVVGETADLSLGDAWLPEYVADGMGTNMVINRDPRIQAILDEGSRNHQITLLPITPDKIADSQMGNFRHKRGTLALRLHIADSDGSWRPPKRISAEGSGWPKFAVAQQSVRMRMAALSPLALLDALRVDDFSVFVKQMAPVLEEYRALYNPWWLRFLCGTRRSVLAIMAKVVGPARSEALVARMTRVVVAFIETCTYRRVGVVYSGGSAVKAERR